MRGGVVQRRAHERCNLYERRKNVRCLVPFLELEQLPQLPVVSELFVRLRALPLLCRRRLGAYVCRHR